MSNIQERLLEEKLRLSELPVPEEMEARLRKKLNTMTPKKKVIWKVRSSWRIAVVVLVVMLLAGNQYHALAYYGKMLLGFDNIDKSTLIKLNNQGKGQTLNEQYQLADGTMLTINGIMSDENQFILFYTLNNLNGLRNYDGFDPFGIKGFQTDTSNIISGETTGPTGGVTATKGYVAFDPVSPQAKKLSLLYWYKLPNSDQRQEGQITFPYRSDEAMPTKFKQPINVTINGKTINIGTITATPTMTLIKGTLLTKNEQLKESVLNGIDLIANGSPVHISSSSWQSKTGAFTQMYEALPENLQSLQLILKKTGETVQIPLNK